MRVLGALAMFVLVAAAGMGLGVQYLVDKYCSLLDAAIERLATWMGYKL